MAMSFDAASQVNSFLEEFTKEETPQVEIATIQPPKDTLTLSGGYVFPDGRVGKLAKVRELNGADEEDLAKASSPGRALNLIFSRGLVSIEGTELSDLSFDDILLGDRDDVLLSIRIATFGNEVEYLLTCMGCGKEQETTVDLLTDVPRHTLVDPATDRVFKVKLKNGEATVALPNMATGRRLLDADSMTQAELFTAVLSGCLISINGMPSLGVKTAQSLGIVDREKIISELYARTPGPRLGEVSKACKACGNEINIPLSLAALFRV